MTQRSGKRVAPKWQSWQLRLPFGVTHIFGTALPGTTVIVFNHVEQIALGAWFVVEASRYTDEILGPFSEESTALTQANQLIAEIDQLVKDVGDISPEDLSNA